MKALAADEIRPDLRHVSFPGDEKGRWRTHYALFPSARSLIDEITSVTLSTSLPADRTPKYPLGARGARVRLQFAYGAMVHAPSGVSAEDIQKRRRDQPK